jgi:hypothetical protein
LQSNGGSNGTVTATDGTSYPVAAGNFLTTDVPKGKDIVLTFGTGVLHLIQINNQPEATTFQFIILSFVYSSTYFGRFPAHHQELK